MCGRFVLDTTAEEIAGLFGLSGPLPRLLPRYNIAPTQQVAAIRDTGSDHGRELVHLHWGLIPSWADDRSIGNRLINARCETASTLPSFRDAMHHRRCIVPARGFYEWKKLHAGGKQPMFIHRDDRRLFAFAGLWESWRDADTGEAIESCTILTREPNELVRTVHDRMPAMLEPAHLARWLDVGHNSESLEACFACDVEHLVMYPVSRRVNKTDHDDPTLIEPVPDASNEQGLLFET